VAVPFDEDDPPDALPVELDQLQRWGVGNRLLLDRLAGISEEECRQAEWRRGLLPPGPLGMRTLESVFEDLRPLVDTTAALRTAPHRSVDVTVDLAGGRQLRGTVSGVRDNTLVGVSFSKLSPAARLKAWINIVALTASDPGTPWAAATVGRGRVRRPECATLPPLAASAAREALEQLVDLYERGLSEPLPLPVKSAADYAASRFGGGDITQARQQAEMKWASGKYPGEDEDGAHVQVWGRRAPLETLLTPRRPDETWGDERDRFGELAVRLWFPILEHEQRGVL
jgi:exodeoxyribonuclease V gamma subunit